MKRAIVAAVIVGSVGAAAWAVVAKEKQSADASTNRNQARTTGRAERRDLVEREDVSGTLGYADTRALTSRLQGTITKLAAEGSTVKRGEALYQVDGRNVRLLYGRRPAWRTLSYGVEDGADVRQLERNLVAMGYDPDDAMDIDGHFDAATEAAVRRWEDDLGLTEDGVLELGEVVFLPGARRIGAHSASIGSSVAPGAEVLKTSSVHPIVTLDLEADRQDLVEEGDRVAITLPDGARVRGRIETVGTVAETDPASEDGAAEPTVEVTISLQGRPRSVLDQAPVTVSIETRRAKDRLAVPVAALLALAEGGYAVEVVDDDGTRLVAVDTGMYADGWVEVEGEGLEEGVEVVVAE